MPKKITIGQWLKGTIKGQWISPRMISTLSRSEEGDRHVFNRLGAVRIYGKESERLTGKKGIAGGSGYTYGGNDPIALWRPAGGNFINPAKAMTNYFGWAYACIRAIQDEIGSTQFKLYKVGKQGDHEELHDHELLTLLDGVNDFQTGHEFKHMLSGHLELAGNAYLLLMGKDGAPIASENEKPTGMWLLNPGQVKILLSKATYPYQIAGYKFAEDGREFRYEPHQVIQIKYPNPNDPYTGLGTIAGMAEWIDNDNYTTEFMKQFFVNGAQLGQTFETEMTSEEQLQELKDSFDQQHSGVKNALKALFLPKGVKKPTGDAGQIKIGDIGVTSLMDSNRDRILAGFRVSKTILGTAESDTNRATAETADYVFSKRTIKPKMELIVSYLNHFLVPRYGDDIFLTFADPVPEDKAFRTTEMQAAVASQPVMSVNEAREQFMGLGPVKGGDSIMSPSIMVPVGNTDKPAADKSAKKASGRAPSIRKTQFARNAELRKSVAGSLKETLSRKLAELKKKGLQDMTDQEYDEVIYKSTRERAGKYEEQLAKAIRDGVNSGQGKEVLSNVRAYFNTKAAKAFAKADIFDAEKWIKITADLATPILSGQFKEEAVYAAEQIGKPGLNVFGSEEAQRAIDHAVSLMSKTYNETVLDQLKEKLNQGLTDGLGLDDMTTLVQDVYTFQDEYAAQRVSRTETVRTANTANKMAWKQAGTVKSVKWYTSGKDNVCPLCIAQNGKVISIDDNFFDKGDTIVGEDGTEITADYSAIGGPPLHPQCGCLIRPWDISPA